MGWENKTSSKESVEQLFEKDRHLSENRWSP
jgi:hypothetical protein